MKQIVWNTPTDTVPFDLAKKTFNTQFYYGVEIANFKGFLIQTGCANNRYRIACFTGMTGGNGWEWLDNQTMTLATAIEAVLRRGQKVFEFQTLEEFAEWMAGKNTR